MGTALFIASKPDSKEALKCNNAEFQDGHRYPLSNKEQMEMILHCWIRELSLDSFPSEIFILIINRFSYHKTMDQKCAFIACGDDDAYLMKVMLIGPANVGKTALLERFTADIFTEQYTPTIGADFRTKGIRVHREKDLLLQIWDTAGQERFTSLAAPFYRGCEVVMFIYDITYRESLMEIKDKWSSYFDHHADIEEHGSIPRILVGNKCDLQKDKECSEEDVLEVVKECGIWTVAECSAKANIGVDALFNEVIPDLFVDEKDREMIEKYPFKLDMIRGHSGLSLRGKALP